VNQDDITDQEISDDKSDYPGESTLLSDLEEEDLDHQQDFLLLGQALRDTSLQTTMVPLPKKRSHADTVTACTPLPNSPNPAGAIAPPLLKHQESTLLRKLSDSDHAPSTQAQPLPKSSGDQNVPQPKSSADQNVPQHQKVTFQVAQWSRVEIVFTKTPWPMISDDKYSMVEETWKLTIEAQHHQWALAGAPGRTPSVCQLRCGPSLKIDPQPRDAVSLGFCLILLYQISDIDFAPKIYIANTEDKNHFRMVSRWGTSNCYLSLPIGFTL